MSLYKRLKQGIQNIGAQSPHQRMSRALIKTLLYRTLMVAITISVAFFFTGIPVMPSVSALFQTSSRQGPTMGTSGCGIESREG